MSKSFILQLLALTALLASHGSGRADDKLSREEKLFSGRIIAIAYKGAADGWIAMSKGKVRSLGDRSFLVGQAISVEGREQTRQLPFWIAMDEVTLIREFEDLDDLKKALGSTSWAFKFGVSQPASDVIEWDGLSVRIPIEYNPDKREQISKLRLFVSEDHAHGWKMSVECEPQEKYFSFTAPKAGEYWFALQIVGKDGRSEPSDSALVANLKLRMREPASRGDSNEVPRRIPPARP